MSESEAVDVSSIPSSIKASIFKILFAISCLTFSIIKKVTPSTQRAFIMSCSRCKNIRKHRLFIFLVKSKHNLFEKLAGLEMK